MKEGLRSGRLKGERDKQVGDDEVKKEGGGCDSGGDKDLHLVSGGLGESERGFMGEKVTENGELGSESANVGGGEIGEKVCVENGEGIESDRVEKKLVKVKEVRLFGRVLRSQTVVNDGGDKPENDYAMMVKSSEIDGCHKKCDEVGNEGIVDQLGGNESENVGGGEVGKKRRRVDNGEGIGDDGVEKKKGKKDEVDGKVTSAVRVLRSRVVVNGACDKAECEGGGQVVRGFKKKLKGKRGRPPKVKKEESDRSNVGLKKNKKLKRKPGRPRKTETEENDVLVGRSKKKLKTEHGVQLGVQETNVVLKGKVDKEGNMNLRSQERMKANMTSNGSYLERRVIGKDLDVKTSPAKTDKKGKYVETEDSEDGDGIKERNKKKKGNKKQKNKQKEQDGEPSKKTLKQLVRDKMVAVLTSAGWTIDRRPRYGRAYLDAVYISPAGKTHWSVTLAYKVLKKHCENGEGNSKFCKAGFKFTPIPPEEVDMLTRIVVKKREGKRKKKQKGKDGRECELSEKQKKGKSLKGKRLLLQHDDSANTACKGRLSLVQDKTKKRKRRAFLVRNSENADSENDGYIPYDGKRTVLAWMVDLGTISLNSKVEYINRRKTQVHLEGRITKDGIHCGCCGETISISKFASHSGNDYPEPFKHMYLESGSSILQCMLDSWNKQDEYDRRGFHFVDVNREDPNDDTCGICGDGGDLICCDGCPSTFHQSCLEIKKFPSGEWHCVYCSCKFCGMFGGTCQTDGNQNVAASSLITCHLCEEKYHQSCIQGKDALNLNSNGPSFCGENCQELFESLQKLLGVRHEIEDGFSLTFIRRSDISSDVPICDTSVEDDCDSKLIECNSKLAVAFLIMDECFLPMVDHRSGVNLIHNILYNCGSNFSRLNYGSFFTAILERGDEIISAATIRIHGNYLAEMPFIGTRYMYRRQGMCRRLLTAIENALGSLNVERLVIPAISELNETWTSVFGFKPLEESSKQKMMNMNILVFPGVEILQKPLKQSTEANMIPLEGLRSTELDHQQIGLEVLCDTNEKRLAGSSGEATAPCGNEANDELAAVESNAQRLCVVSQDTLEGKSNTIMIPSPSVCDVNEHQSSASVPDVRAVEVDTQQNQHIRPEVESKSFTLHHIDSEATDFGMKGLSASMQGTKNTDCKARIKEADSDARAMEVDTRPNQPIPPEVESKSCTLHHIDSEATDSFKVLSASMEGTESTDCEVRIEEDTLKDLNSHNDGSVCRSTEKNAAELQNMALVPEVKDPDENAVCHDSETTTLASHDATDQHESQKFQVAGYFCPDGMVVETCDVECNHPASQYTPTVMVEVQPESIKRCGSKILTETSQVSSDVLHPTPLLADQRADDLEGTLPVGFSMSRNGLDTHKVVSTPTDSNGITKFPEVMDVDLNSNGSLTETKSLKQFELDSQVDSTSVAQCNPSGTSVLALHCASGGGNSCGNGIIKPPEVTNVDLTSNGSPTDRKSLEQSELDSEVDNSTAAQCDSGNTSVGALHCASGGGNSGASSEVMIVSNQAS